MQTTEQYIQADQAYEEGDYAKAFAIFLNLANSNDVNSMSRIATMYLDALGVDKDIQKSIEWDLKAISLGSTTSLLNLGITYNKIGDFENAKSCFEKLMLQGDGEAALELAKLFFKIEADMQLIQKTLKQVLISQNVSPDGYIEAQDLLRSITT